MSDRETQSEDINLRRPYRIVGEKLKKRIESNEFPVGSRLPSERVLSDMYQVGRTVIRDAIIMLELHGYIEVRQGSGIYVLETSDTNTPANTETLSVSSSGPFEMLQARQLIESNIARLAANKVTEHDLVNIEAALTLQKASINMDIKEDADKKFHLAVAAATQNSELVDIVESLWIRRDNNPLWKAVHMRITTADYQQQWVSDHMAIFSALQQRDTDAAYNAMWNHLENVKYLFKKEHEIDQSN